MLSVIILLHYPPCVSAYTNLDDYFASFASSSNTVYDNVLVV